MNKTQSMEIKGIAILFMFLLHLFNTWNYQDIYTPYFTLGVGTLTYYVSLYADICVAMFLFVSGYGLYWKFTNIVEKSSYSGTLLPGLKGLMVNYWLIIVIFPVIIGSILGYSASHPGDFQKLLLNISGLDTSYSGAWWFLTTYILLALTSGNLYRFIDKFHFLLSATLVLTIYTVGYIQRMKEVIHFDNPLLNWFVTEGALYGNSLLPFVVGAWFVKYDVVNRLKNKIPKGLSSVQVKLAIVLILVLLFMLKIYLPSLFFAGFFFVATITLYLLWNPIGIGSKILAHLGNHSTNLWLIHMFVYMQFDQFKPLIYWSKDPILILFSLIVVCLAFSYPINWVKGKLLKLV